MNKKVKIIIGYLLGFICALLICVLTSLLIIKYSISRSYVNNVINVNDYYNKLYLDTREEMENFMVSSGFPFTILDDIYTADDIKEDVNAYINNLYRGIKTEINKSKIIDKLNNNIDKYLKENNIDVVNRKDIESFNDEIASIYDKEMTLYHTFDSFLSMVPKLDKLINIGIVVCSIIMVITIILLIIWIKTLSIGSCLMASGFILLFLRFVIVEKIDIENILIITENFSDILQIILLNIRKMLLIGSIILLVLGVVTIVVSSIRNKGSKLLKMGD